MSGPPRTPTPLLVLRGSDRAAKRVKTEPVAPTGSPQRPAWVTGKARKHWERTIPKLARMGVLSTVDGNALARYCDFFAQWLEARAWIVEHGTTYPLHDNKGNVKCFMPWPQVSQYNRLGTQLLRIEQEFGLTPAARSRLTISTKDAPPGSGYVNTGKAG